MRAHLGEYEGLETELNEKAANSHEASLVKRK
jgi:hypothetical protein